MTILRFGPLLAIASAACLVAWTPVGRVPEPAPRLALSAPKLASPFADADPSKPALGRAASLESFSTVGAIPASVPAPSVEDALGEAARSGKEVKVQLAYADLEGAAPALGALWAIAPHAEMAALEPSAPPPAAPEASAPAATPTVPLPPRTPEAVVLFKKGDAAGLLALASAATDADERSALEWAALRADAHPSFDLLAAFLKAHPRWPSRAWIRDRQEAELAAHPQAPAEIAAFFASDAPQSSAGKIAAARAAQATGRPEEASQIIRSLWRDGNVDALAESVILRDFGASLTKADHAHRADRLLYAGYLGAGARAAALAGPDVLALAQARIATAREPMSPGLVKAVPPALRNDPGLLFSRIQYARRAGRVYEAAVMLSLAPHDRAALVNPDRWWSERKMVARTLLDLDEARLAFEICDQTVHPDLSEAQVDAAFHAGWIALRFLDDAPSAAKRFALAADAAENPLSAARAAYWQGRAAEAMGDFRGGQDFLCASGQRADRLLRPARCATSWRDSSRFPRAGCAG